MAVNYNILTWNVGGKSSTKHTSVLHDLLEENEIHILILQESYQVTLAAQLPSRFTEVNYISSETSNGTRVFIEKDEFSQIGGWKGISNKLVWTTFKTRAGDLFNLFAVHMYSKLNKSSREQMWKSREILKKVKELEANSICPNRSIIVGDLNKTPFDKNLNDPYLIDTRDSRHLINLHQTFLKEELWYNPMWNFLGDNNSIKHTGTYYTKGFKDTLNWHLIDGFIVRPIFMNSINFKKSGIVTGTKKISLINSTLMSKDDTLVKKEYSDHLPFKFSIKL